MEQKINILLWAIGGGFAGTWYAMWKLFMRLEDRLTQKIDSLDEKIIDVDRRLCRLEGAFSSKEGCLLRYEHEKSGKVE